MHIRFHILKVLEKINFLKNASKIKEQEIKAILSIIEKTIDHGNYFMANVDDAYLQPILSTNDCKNHIVSALKRVIDFCKK